MARTVSFLSAKEDGKARVWYTLLPVPGRQGRRGWVGAIVTFCLKAKKLRHEEVTVMLAQVTQAEMTEFREV